jgi:hypothetical protein
MTFLEWSQSDGSGHLEVNHEYRKATRFPEGINRIDSGKLKLKASVRLHDR